MILLIEFYIFVFCVLSHLSLNTEIWLWNEWANFILRQKWAVLQLNHDKNKFTFWSNENDYVFILFPNYLTLPSFDLEGTWRLFQKHVVHTKLHIKIFIVLDKTRSGIFIVPSLPKLRHGVPLWHIILTPSYFASYSLMLHANLIYLCCDMTRYKK